MIIGLPQIKIAFKEAIKRAMLSAGKGVVAIILDDTVANVGIHEIYDLDEIPAGLTDKNKKYLTWVSEGFGAKPQKVIAYVKEATTDISEALEYFEGTEFNYMNCPYADNEALVKVEAFINKICALGTEVFGVLQTKTLKPSTENLIYITFTDSKIVDEVLTAADLSVIVAGMAAGCPNPLSLTFATVPFLTDMPKLGRDELNTRIGNGEIVLLKEAGEIRIARGVTAFTEDTETKGYAYKKIKTVSTMKLIKNDIRLTLAKNYIGKVPNSYNNKMLLVGAIHEYLLGLADIQLIEKDFNVAIDFDAQKKYLKEELGLAVNDMTEQQILEANTKDKVFLVIVVKLLDSIEDIFIEILL